MLQLLFNRVGNVFVCFRREFPTEVRLPILKAAMFVDLFGNGHVFDIEIPSNLGKSVV